MAWVSPTGHVETAKWTDEANAYDENTGTYAYQAGGNYGNYLELTHASLSCDKIQIWVYSGGGQVYQVEVFYGGSWHTIYSGTPASEEWVEIPIGSTQDVTAAQIKQTVAFKAAYVYEFDFNEVEAGEEKLLTATCSATSSTIGSLTLGKIESLTATSATATNVPSTTLQLLYSITAHAPPATSVTGSLSIVKSLSGTSSVASSTQGSLTLGKVETLLGTSSVQTSVSGTLTIAVYLTSSASVVSTTSGSLTVLGIIFLSGTASISSSVSSPNIRLLRQIAGTSSVASLAQGSLTLGKVEVLSGTAAITSSTQGSLTLGIIETLAGTASAQSSTTAQLCVLWALSATSGAISTITGSLTVINLVKLMKKLIQLEEIEV